jgi:hypothetical protein
MSGKDLMLFITGLLLVASGLVLQFLGYIPADSGGMAGLIAAGIVLILFPILREWRSGDFPAADERTKKIGAYGITYSWLLTIVWLCAVFWVTDLSLVKLTPQAVAFITMFLMIISARAFQWHLFRKGDVE